ncbi:helix-turn-helix transcriptional regulator [Schaalia sp. ZJ405]|uniref:helix-turn-helix domain-containing protein n=1 Tax=Schaalia sp. ZJ405 TaxID=2709403 RepID=UPI0013EAD117|nr:helix-turn-helix transcriptional regulator [Schaalia sp. ZJ405]QPK81150.1 helix-turn-helix transcriptional regulator [Schaalia sp. ZJ405]
MSHRNPLAQVAAGALRAEMSRQKKTSNDLAFTLNISQSSASRRMTGEVSLDLDDLDTISQWLNVPLGVLLTEPPVIEKSSA